MSSDDDDDDDNDNDEWSPANNTINGSMQRESSDSDDGFDSSDDEPLANKADVEDKSGYKFNKRRAFIPPSDLQFIDAPVEPEPKDDTPYNYFKSFVTDEMFEHIALESNKYAHQKKGEILQTTAQELETFVGLYFHMGLVKMQSVCSYWENETRYPPVADVMPRNRFQKIASMIHLQDNLEVTEEQKQDKAWKIRPWFDYLNLNFATVSPSENQSIDEAIVAFKGRSHLKQYLPKKPKKWGFKLWARCSSTGFMHEFDLYQGKGTGRDDPDDVADCGLGGNVVLKLTASLPSNRGFKIFADNYFSNLAMAGELAKRGFCYVGTITANRLHGAPLKSEKELTKEGRGSYHCVVETTQNLSLVRWLDNRCVTVVSTYLAADPVGSVQRYDR